MEKLIFGIITILVAITDFIICIKVYTKKNRRDNYMATTILLSGVVALSYLVGAFSTDYFTTSFFMAIHFSAISIMLNTLFSYILYYTGSKKTKLVKAFCSIFHSYCLFDVIVLMLNPFWEITIHYNYRPGQISIWEFQPEPLYQLHLIFCYVLITAVFFLLIRRTILTPTVYRAKYLAIFGGILFVVLLNAIFLIFQSKDMLDLSILFYSIIDYFMFWNRYSFSKKGMLNSVRQMILNELEQPLFLFDKDNELVMCSSLGEKFFNSINTDDPNKTVTFQQFVRKCNFPMSLADITSDIHFQLNYKGERGNISIYRVDLKFLRDKKNRTIGKLIAMTDTSLEMDLLTGFHSKNSFEGFFRNINPTMNYPVAVAICDLNKLSQINRTMGEEQGDIAIQKLAQAMIHNLPKTSYFARLEDANLLAVCPETDIEQMREYIGNIRSTLNEVNDFCIPLEIQSAISVATEEKPSIIEAEETAFFSMKSKKLMDGTSAHSSLLDSLAQTLLESDNTTRAHVERTKNMGELLGKRLGFSDAQQAKLALLCLLHDIGKLGIPLEILNKPGKLNSAEWDVMKSHVEKGYRIAKASAELEDIAELILHHHESWNGKGYPDGLKQESIPLLSRVIAIVDTYDAMTNDRPYHKAVSDYEAREELRRCAGVQFDPSIVSEFLALLNELNPLDKNTNNSEPEVDKYTPRGVKEIFATNTTTDSENILPLNYTKYIVDENSKILSVSDNFEELTGYSKKDIKKYNLSQFDLIPREEKNSYLQIVTNEITSNGEAFIEHPLLRKDGSIRNVVCFGKNYFDSVTREPRSEIVVFDISTTSAVSAIQESERESAARALLKWENLMRKDSLTGLLNHESFINDVEMELLKKDQTIVLMVLDVDYFKKYNDNYGHLAGDKILSLVAIMLESSVRDIGFSGRLGGDEFGAALVLPSNATEEKIHFYVEQTFTTIMNAISTQEQGATISLGAASNPDITTFNELYQAADKALYRAKDKGRKCFSF